MLGLLSLSSMLGLLRAAKPIVDAHGRHLKLQKTNIIGKRNQVVDSFDPLLYHFNQMMIFNSKQLLIGGMVQKINIFKTIRMPQQLQHIFDQLCFLLLLQ